MEKNLISSFEKFKNQNYEISTIEFDLLQVKFNLSFSLTKNQFAQFEKFEQLMLKLISKKENQFIEFILDEIEFNKKEG